MANRSKTRNGERQGSGGDLRLWHVLALLILLVPPGMALHRLSAVIGIGWLAGYSLTISLLTYAVYGADKDSAQAKRADWRAPENLLHGLELAGGWPGAYLAQLRFRHKCSKPSYQIVFWLIVSLHLYLATDYLLGWRLPHAVVSLLVHRNATP